MCGTKSGEISKLPVALIDILTAHQLKEAILLALIKRDKTGVGSYVATSLYESAISSLANQASNYLNNNNIPKPLGTEHPNIAPYGEIFECKTGEQLVLAIGTEDQFQKLILSFDLAEQLNKGHFATNTKRIKNRNELQNILKEKFRQLNYATIDKTLKSKGIPFGKIKNMKEVFQDPHIAESMILSAKNEEGKIMKTVKTIAFKMQ